MTLAAVSMRAVAGRGAGEARVRLAAEMESLGLPCRRKNKLAHGCNIRFLRRKIKKRRLREKS